MSCSQVRRELLQHFALSEELGPRSGPHLAHIESCAECRREVGIDRELVRHLRRALRERVEGSAASEGSWELVRRRTIDRPEQTWRVRALHWGGVASAAAAAIMMFAVATAPETRLLPETQSPFLASAARRAVPPVEEANDSLPTYSAAYVAPLTEPPLRGWQVQPQLSDEPATRDVEPPITGHMR